MIRGATATRRLNAAFAVALLAGLLTEGTAAAKDSQDTGTTAAPSAPPAVSGTGALGVPYVIRQGFFVEAQVGLFTAFGGMDVNGAAKGASNGQPWVNIDIGFYIPGVKHLSLFLGAGHGLNDGVCRYGVAGTGCDYYSIANDTSQGQAPTDFSVIPIEAGIRFGYADVILPNMFLTATLVGGYTMFTPALTEQGPTGAPHAGVGLGIEYATRLPGFSFGIEVMFRMAFLPAISGETITPPLPAAPLALAAQPSQLYPFLTAYPRFQYVF